MARLGLLLLHDFPEPGKFLRFPCSSPPSDTSSPQVRALYFAPPHPRDANLMLVASGSCLRTSYQRREPVGGVALAARQHVGVHRHRHDGAGVAEPLRDDVHRHARGQQHRGVRVPAVPDDQTGRPDAES
jgi:hypothetical protein